MRFRFSKTLAILLAAVVLCAFVFHAPESSAVLLPPVDSIDFNYLYGDVGLVVQYFNATGLHRARFVQLTAYNDQTIKLSTSEVAVHGNVYYNSVESLRSLLNGLNYNISDGLTLMAVPVNYLATENLFGGLGVDAYFYVCDDSTYPTGLKIGSLISDQDSMTGNYDVESLIDQLVKWRFFNGGGRSVFNFSSQNKQDRFFIYASSKDFGSEVSISRVNSIFDFQLPQSSAVAESFDTDLQDLLDPAADGGFVTETLQWFYRKFPFIGAIIIGMVAGGLIVMLV